VLKCGLDQFVHFQVSVNMSHSIKAAIYDQQNNC
jgi:hypothetical protein